MLRSIADKDTKAFWKGARIGAFQPFERVAIRKLTELNAAINLESLGKIPGNRLERLKGDRKGQHSMRINDQWRICFNWSSREAFEVEITKHYA